ncbi:hypothetical protein C8Q79DRAFT_1005697 [Trametes meyenii]|nr:hypothetical protein C8Q79DRAFT_1005697 [Trametes meyenii]
MEARTDAAGNGTAPTASGRYERHPHLYLEHEGGTTVLLAERTLFKVHEYFLKRHSIVFASMFTLRPGDTPLEGQSDDLPILLPDVSAVDFARFLFLFYPRNIVTGDLTTLDEWTSVLRIAHRYEFEAYVKLAVERIDKLASPVERILLARRYDIPAWLEQAYFALCVREASLTLDEGTHLGMEDVILISDLRQRIRGPQGRFAFAEQHVRWTIRSCLHTPSPS